MSRLWYRFPCWPVWSPKCRPISPYGVPAACCAPPPPSVASAPCQLCLGADFGVVITMPGGNLRAVAMKTARVAARAWVQKVGTQAHGTWRKARAACKTCHPYHGPCNPCHVCCPWHGTCSPCDMQHVPHVSRYMQPVTHVAHAMPCAFHGTSRCMQRRCTRVDQCILLLASYYCLSGPVFSDP